MSLMIASKPNRPNLRPNRKVQVLVAEGHVDLTNVQAGRAERNVRGAVAGGLLQIGTAAVVGRDAGIQPEVRRQIVAPLRRGDCEREGSGQQTVTDLGHLAATNGPGAA